LNGNQISTGYAYDAENRLVQANAGAIQYAYDGQNNSTPFTISLNYTDTAQHQIALYCVDWDTTARQQRVDILDSNGNVLNSQNVSSFNGGIYLVWKVSGHIAIRVTSTGGLNAVISGLFFDLTNTGNFSNLLRTYSYDTNPYDANYSQNSAGRLTAIQYGAINYDVVFDAAPGSTTFTDMFSYWPAGNVAGKRLRVTKVAPYPNGQNHTQTAVGDLNMAYAYNYEGKLTSVTYPTDASGTTPQFTYSYDNMMRPVGMTDQTNASIVSGVQYGVANELKQMTYIGGATETRQYNSLLQLTDISGLGQNVTYTFPDGQNAGKLVSQIDHISGETVNYAYDTLNRLASAGATSNAWSQTYSYDGFGNLTNRVGTGAAQSTTISTPANLATNQLSGYTYDPNGNQISTGYAYDAENRMVQANAGAIQYGYDAQNKRIWQASFSNCSGDWCLSSDSVSLFGIDGKLIATYSPQPGWNNTQTQIPIPFYVAAERVYFGRKLVATLGGSGYLQSVVQNRLESAGQYYPFGEQRTAPPPTAYTSFATYTRDSATGLDYADQRDYASTFGRFMSADRYRSREAKTDPYLWNNYAYVGNDPMNYNDPSGRDRCTLKSDNEGNFTLICNFSAGNESGGGGGDGGGSPGSLRDDDGRIAALAEKRALGSFPIALRQIVENAIGRSENDLTNPDCASLFGTLFPEAGTLLTETPANAFEDFFEGAHIRGVVFDSLAQPGVGAYHLNGNIYIATNRYFFTGIDQEGASVLTNPMSVFNGLTYNQMQEVILIHEFLHASGVVGNDSEGQTITLGNGQVVVGSQGVTAAVRQHCLH
jgi:RHS repeat-associated protein